MLGARGGSEAAAFFLLRGKSLKTLMSKGILQNRGRLADKRTVALPPTRGLKKELTPSFSARDGDSSRSGLACGQRLGLKQEDDPHVRIMKRRVHTHWDVNISFRETSCSQDSDLPTLISSVHRSRHLVMPEHQSRCEFQRGSVEIGLGSAVLPVSLLSGSDAATPSSFGRQPGRPTEEAGGGEAGCPPGAPCDGDLLGKRLGHSPHVSSDCPLEKKARSKSPQAETLLLPELGPSMAPEDHYRRLVSALSEASTFEDPQRLYHLGLPGHDLLRVRQEVAAAAVRSPSGLEVHLPSTTAGQRRKQGLTQHREGTAPAGTPSFSESESKETTGSGVWAQDGSEDEPPKDSDGEDPEMAAAGGQGPTPGQAPAGGASSEGKGLLSGSMLPPPLPLGLPYAVSPCFHTGAMGGLFMDGEEATAPEDVSKWTVDDVCSFVGGLSGCGEYAPVFREQGIDGETLPLLTEEHLLTTMGLKLGPALKIRAQVAKRLGRVFYMASFPVALPLQPPTLRASERELTSGEQPLSPTMAPSPFGGPHPSAGRASPKQENGTMALLPGPADPSQPLC
ncbi:sterile alpha motif domain-containing protein 11 [Camelus ferus]|nr:sterile alpha motif domain-containing protein 11 [Camelus ferus]